MNLEELQKKIGYHGVLLAVVGLATSAALALANHSTTDAIKAAEAQDLQNSLKQVLPEGLSDNDLLKDSAEFDKGDGSSVTAAFRNDDLRARSIIGRGCSIVAELARLFA